MRLAVLLAALAPLAPAAAAPVLLPTGQALTPQAAPGAVLQPLVVDATGRTGLADGAAAMAVSPSGRLLAVLTSGFNGVVGADGKPDRARSTQVVMIYRLGGATPVLQQVVRVANSYGGLAWLPGDAGLLVPGGVDDTLHVLRAAGGRFAEPAPPIALGHGGRGNGPNAKPQAAGVALSPDGARALVANYYNDSVSLVDLATGRVVAERDLRPGRNDPARRGVAGGEFPLSLAWVSPTRAYVSAPRDREVVALAITGDAVTVAGRTATAGEPTALLAAGDRLYAAEDNADRLAVIDAATGRLLAEPRVGFPAALGPVPGKGLNPNALALAADGRLLVSYGGVNAVALVAPGPGATLRVEGLVPTGWYPSAVAVAGGQLLVANRKSPPGPNPQGCGPKVASYQSQAAACGAANQYIFQLEKAGLLSLPLPGPAALVATTAQVARNLGLPDAGARAAAERTMAALRTRIRHVVFVVKENRTYDQVLGDLGRGNGDPSLAILGARLSPTHHAIARQFVTLDNFLDAGEQSSTGWTWTTGGRVPDVLERTAPVNYAGRGLSYEAEQADRFVYTGLPAAERRRVNPAIPDDPDLLPGPALLTAPDADDDVGDKERQEGQGFLWHQALRAGLTVRNYGVADASVYDADKPGAVPPLREPWRTGTRIYTPGDPAFAGRSDPYFRGFDMKLADYWRVQSWLREFAEQDAKGTMPRLTLMRLSHDHFGDFKEGLDGVNTVETQMADNDYALGLVLERIARSRFARSTLVFVVEDDAQNGADHVDARRSVAFVAGPYVRRGAVVSTRYTTLNVLRTMEGVLGLKPLAIGDALATPMADVFDLAGPADWSFRAVASPVLRATALPVPADAYDTRSASACPTRSAAWWADAMRGQDFSSEDRLDTPGFNAALWRGLAGCR